MTNSHPEEFNESSSLHAIIMAGGHGVRLSPYTSILPKPLLPVGDKPIIEILVRQLRNSGFGRISLAVGYLAQLIELFLGDGSKFGVKIDYSTEFTPLGTIGPLTLMNNLEDNFLVMNADLLTSLDYKDFLRFHTQHQAIATVGIYRYKFALELGVVKTNGMHELEEYVEKPELSFDVSMGIYAFSKRVLDYLTKGVRADFPDLFNNLIKSGERVVGYHFDGYWLDIGRHTDLDRAVQEFNQIRGELRID